MAGTQAHGVRSVGYFDCAGGGQVVVRDRVAYIGHMKGPLGTSIVDVSDPSRPRLMTQLNVADGVHSHKVRVENGIMVINNEAAYDTFAQKEVGAADKGFRGGLRIFDVSTPSRPREISFWECGGRGVHRFTFDGRYAYISPEMDGYVGNIVMILDLIDPEKPREVGRWWMPGQWVAGGETPTWDKRSHRCHHPIRLGNRLYVSYWHGGFVILDIDDMSKPKFVSGLDWSPPFACPTHTALPIPFDVRGRRLLLVADEDVHRIADGPPGFLMLVDITDEQRPVPFSSFQVEDVGEGPHPTFSFCHQPCEEVRGTEIPVAYFSRGLRIIDIANPHAIKETAYFVPPTPEGADGPSSNDVVFDDRGLIYLIDRHRGLHIVERV